MSTDTLLTEIMKVGKEVISALFIEDGQLKTWRGRQGVMLPPEDKIKDLLFQRVLINSLLNLRKEYVGKMHFSLTRHDLQDVLHFSWTIANKEIIVLVSLFKSPNPFTIIEKLQSLILHWRSNYEI